MRSISPSVDLKMGAANCCSRAEGLEYKVAEVHRAIRALRACDNGLVITTPVQISPLAVWVPWSSAWHAKLYPGADYMGVWEHYCLEFKAIQGPEKSAFRVGHTCCYSPKKSSKVWSICLLVPTISV